MYQGKDLCVWVRTCESGKDLCVSVEQGEIQRGTGGDRPLTIN